MTAPPCRTSVSGSVTRQTKPMHKCGSGNSEPLDLEQNVIATASVLMTRLKQSAWPNRVREIIGQQIQNLAGTRRHSGIDLDELAENLEDLPLEAGIPLSQWASILAELMPELYRENPLGKWPTKTMPGTVDKLILLKRRRKGGFNLWHPQDLTNA